MLQFEKPIYKITDSVESNFYGKFEFKQRIWYYNR